MEVIAFGDITFRLDARNLSNVDICRDRIRYVGHIADNVLEEIEYMCSTMGTTVSLKVSGTFQVGIAGYFVLQPYYDAGLCVD